MVVGMRSHYSIVTTSRSLSIVALPMPFIFDKSSTLLKAPLACLYSTMRSAMVLPIPGSFSNSLAVALLILILLLFVGVVGLTLVVPGTGVVGAASEVVGGGSLGSASGLVAVSVAFLR